MKRAARIRLLACITAMLLQLFGAIGPVWALAAECAHSAADPMADAEICSAHAPAGHAGARSGSPSHHQPPGGICPHCQWCHAHPVAVTVPPSRVPLPRANDAIAQDSTDIPLPRAPPARIIGARAPPALI